MAEENQTGADGQQEPEQHSPAPKDVNNAKPRTFTQEEVDRIINERLGRERGRKSDYEELKEKAGQTADLESKLSGAREGKAQKRVNRPNTRRSSPRYAPTSRPNTASPTRASSRVTKADRRIRRETHEGVRRHAFPRTVADKRPLDRPD
ncbi:MAG: hypothetical protein ACLTDO_09725 [Bifidobacterium pseudocatenulatum]